MPPRSRPAGSLTSGFEISMHHVRQSQTPAVVDTTVNIAAGAFVAVAALGLVLIHGPALTPIAAIAAPLAYVANRSYLRYRSQRVR